MIDFKNSSFVALSRVKDSEYEAMVQPLFVEGEEIIQTVKSVRAGIVFTTKRMITINVQGFTGKKKDFTTMPYSKIQMLSVETAGTFELDSELVLWFSGVGCVKFEFRSDADITGICRTRSNYVL